MNLNATSWKTTSAGIIAIVGGITRLVFAIKANQFTEEAILSTVTTVLIGVGLLFSKDSNVTGGTDVAKNSDPAAVKASQGQ